MNKLKNHTRKELKKALIKSYKELIDDNTKLRLQYKCIASNVCPNCLQYSRVRDGNAFRCSECGLTLTGNQYDKIFKKIW